MDFSFCPDNGPPRLIRYVKAGTLPAKNLLAIFDRGSNLLIIDSDYFSQLTSTEQHLAIRTQEPYLEVQHLPNKPLRLVA